MQESPQFKDWRMNVAHSKYTFNSMWNNSWPIRWEQLKDIPLIQSIITRADRPIKIALGVGLGVTLVSSFIFLYGGYLVATVSAPAIGGDFREAVIQQDVRRFVPVTDPTSEIEKKITSLLYHPLYTIQYPDFGSSDEEPSITPVLLDKAPEWVQTGNSDVSDQSYRQLRFTLKDNIKWSNGEPITLDDVIYTFNLLNNEEANSQYQDVLSRVQLQPVPNSETEFDLISETPFPQLRYNANFSPISRDYYESDPLERINASQKSFKPLVTSGAFTFTDGTVIDPDNPRGEVRENPIRDDDSDWKTIILQRNEYQNHVAPFFDRYIITQYDRILDPGGNDSSIEAAAKEGNVDLFARFTGFQQRIPSQGADSVQEALGLNQHIANSNTYFSLFLNARTDSQNPLKNRFMRKYIICSFIKEFEVSANSNSMILPIPENRRLLPIQFNQDQESGCSDNPADHLAEGNADAGEEIYVLQQDERTGITRVLIQGGEFKLILIGVSDSEPLLTQVQLAFKNMGMPADLIKDSRVNTLLQSDEKTYSAAFLPTTIISQDPYPLFGGGGLDVSYLRNNNRITDYDIETNLLSYSQSGLTNASNRETLISFFANEYVSTTLGRGTYEYNYSDKILGMRGSFPELATLLEDVYASIPDWYVDTKRNWK